MQNVALKRAFAIFLPFAITAYTRELVRLPLLWLMFQYYIYIVTVARNAACAGDKLRDLAALLRK